MKNSNHSTLDKFLKLDFNTNDKIWLTEQKSLRKLVGILGVMMPLLLYLFLWIDSGVTFPMDSISHYYFTRACGVFIIIVSLLAIFLLVYKGKAKTDFYISSIAGIFALCLLLFPTSNITDCCDLSKPYSVTFLKTIGDFRVSFHYVSAAIFLSFLAFMSFFLFTKSNKGIKERTPQKRIRNRFYRTNAVIMVLAILVILAGRLSIITEPFYTTHHLTFWMETLAVESFGLSWLIKGELFLKDK